MDTSKQEERDLKFEELYIKHYDRIESSGELLLEAIKTNDHLGMPFLRMTFRADLFRFDEEEKDDCDALKYKIIGTYAKQLADYELKVIESADPVANSMEFNDE